MKTTKRRHRAFVDTRLRVNPTGDWRMYTTTVPKGCTVLGTVSRGANTGALVRLESSKNLVKVTHGQIEMLNQQQVHLLLDAATRASTTPEMVSVEEWEHSKGWTQ